MNFSFNWRSDFKFNTAENFDQAQKFIDSEVLRLSDPLIPMQTGKLKQSGMSGTKIGSGEVIYTAIYSKPQYYSKETREYDANRGGQWFERMKEAHRDNILEGAAKRMKGI
jgi:hypothetical protein